MTDNSLKKIKNKIREMGINILNISLFEIKKYLLNNLIFQQMHKVKLSSFCLNVVISSAW